MLFDSNDIVWLIQRLNGLEARVFLSFAPVSHPGDLKFLRWLGADLPGAWTAICLPARERRPALRAPLTWRNESSWMFSIICRPTRRRLA
jgi:hypothetical protein